MSVLMLLGLAFAGTAHAQTPAPKFEVASIKPTDPGNAGNQMFASPGGRFTGINATLKSLIRFGFGVQDHQISGASGWMATAGFDITAKTGSNSVADLRLMVQTLLADRFQLKFHRETKELPTYVLAIGKHGSKLHEVSAPGLGVGMGRSQLNGRGADTATLASVLSGQLGRSVIDGTGLKGFYDFVLTFEPDESRTADTPGPSIFTAVEEQLGLKLEATKGPVEIIVIDHAERPDWN